MDRTRRLVLPVLGLECGGGGSRTVEKVVRRVRGVAAVYVNPAVERAYIDYDGAQCGPDDLCDAVEAAGYRAVHPSRRVTGNGGVG